MIPFKGMSVGGFYDQKKSGWLIFALLCILPASLLFSCSGEPNEYKPETGHARAQKEYRPEVGYLAPDFTLEVMGWGKMVNLSDYKGKVVLLNFWATWCIPCRKEMPSMEELYNTFKEREFEILAVNLEKFAGEKVAAFVSNYGITFPILLDRELKTPARYGVRSIPTTYIIGKDGIIKEKIIGGRNWTEQEFVERINSLMGS